MTYVLLPLFVFALFVAVVPAQAQGAVVITNCSSDAQLRQALSAPGSSQVSFNCGPGAHSIPISGVINVQGAVVVEGGNAITFDGNNSSGILQIFASATLELRNLKIERGSTASLPALENFGTLTLDGVQFARNQGGSKGAAVTNYKSLTARDTSFIDNRASAGRSGGAIRSESGAIALIRSTLSGNTIAGSLSTGGAIALNNTKLSVVGSSFSANSAFDGGAIWLDATSSAAITDTLFVANQASYGGAIESSGAIDIDQSDFVGNRATTGDGGALWVMGNDADISFSSFSDNQAATTGGAISCYSNTVSLVHSTVSANRAGTHGGGIYSTCNVNLTNSTLSGNTAAQGGGALYQSGSGSATVAAATIAFNSALFGAGVYKDGASAASLSLSATLLNKNTPDDCGGVISSLGDNLSGDTTCAALTQTGDKKAQLLPLGALADNGGPTQTHMLLAGNPAIDALPPARCAFANDQRAAKRPVGINCDIGALEAGAILPRLYLPLVVK